MDVVAGRAPALARVLQAPIAAENCGSLGTLAVYWRSESISKLAMLRSAARSGRDGRRAGAGGADQDFALAAQALEDLELDALARQQARRLGGRVDPRQRRGVEIDDPIVGVRGGGGRAAEPSTPSGPAPKCSAPRRARPRPRQGSSPTSRSRTRSPGALRAEQAAHFELFKLEPLGKATEPPPGRTGALQSHGA